MSRELVRNLYDLVLVHVEYFQIMQSTSALPKHFRRNPECVLDGISHLSGGPVDYSKKRNHAGNFKELSSRVPRDLYV